MENYGSILFGYFFVVFFGNLFISRIIKCCWCLLKKDYIDYEIAYEKLEAKTTNKGLLHPKKIFLEQTPGKVKIKEMLGAVELILLTTLFYIDKPIAIGVWLSIKIAISWKSFDQEKVFSSHNIFLLGITLLIIISYIGAKYIKIITSSF